MQCEPMDTLTMIAKLEAAQLPRDGGDGRLAERRRLELAGEGSWVPQKWGVVVVGNFGLGQE